MKDREAWCAAVHRITKSWTQLSDWITMHPHQLWHCSDVGRVPTGRLWLLSLCVRWKPTNASQWPFRHPNWGHDKFYCLKCLDVYTQKSLRCQHMDGIYFGTGFPYMLFTVHPSTDQRGAPTRLCPGSMVSRSILWSSSSSSKLPATLRALLRRFADASPDLTLSLWHIHYFAASSCIFVLSLFSWTLSLSQ